MMKYTMMNYTKRATYGSKWIGLVAFTLLFFATTLLFPLNASAGSETITVTVSVENLSFTTDDVSELQAAPAWEGKLFELLATPGVSGGAINVIIPAQGTVQDALQTALGTVGFSETTTIGAFQYVGVTSGYITSVHGLSAGDMAGSGGWMYALNGRIPSVGMNQTYLREGDHLQLLYSDNTWDTGYELEFGNYNSPISGFVLTPGVFSYLPGEFANTYTHTILSSGGLTINAVPNSETKTVRIFKNSNPSEGLGNSIDVSHGDELLIVVGDYEDVYTIQIRTVDQIDIDTVLDSISALYNSDLTDYWYILGKMSYDPTYIYPNNAKEAYLDRAITDISNTISLPTARSVALHIIALKAMGYDASRMAAFDIGEFNGYTFLENARYMDTEDHAYALIAYLQASESSYDVQINEEIASLEGSQIEGRWGADYGVFGAYYSDTTSIVLLALNMAKAQGYNVESSVVDAAADYLVSQILSNHTVPATHDSANGSPDTTAFAAMALRSVENETPSVLPGLGLFITGDEGGFVSDYTNTFNTMSTKNGFLGLIASRSDSMPFYILDFRNRGSNFVEPTPPPNHSRIAFSLLPSQAVVTVKNLLELTQVPAAAGWYDLPEGTYNYTVARDGYQTKSGTFSVSSTDATSHVRKTIQVSLSSAPTTTQEITVRVHVKSRNDHSMGIFTYKNNSNLYSNLASETVTLKAGSSVFDALDAALTQASVPYEESSLGYIGSINGLSEFQYVSTSGWLYRVNGVTANIGSRDYKLTADATVIWFYTDDFPNEYGSESWSAPLLPGASMEIRSSINTNGIANATLSGSKLNDFLKALASNDVRSGSTATIEIDIDTDAEGFALSFPSVLLHALGETTYTTLEILTNMGTLTIDPVALSAILTEAGGTELTLQVSRFDNHNLSHSIQTQLGNRPVYEFTLKAGSKEIADFGNGYINVSLPYHLPLGEKAEEVTVFNITGGDSLQEIVGSRYDPMTKTVHFKTNHFSKFAIGIRVSTEKLFTDVPASHWSYKFIMGLTDKGIVTGRTATQFAPDSTITRAEFAMILAKTAGADLTVARTNGFDDVKTRDWYASAVAWAKEAGIVSGYKNSDGTYSFRPSDVILRQDMAVMIQNLLLLQTGEGLATIKEAIDFKDEAEIASYAKTAVASMQQASIIHGVKRGEDAFFLPKSTATRAEAAVMIWQALQNK